MSAPTGSALQAAPPAWAIDVEKKLNATIAQRNADPKLHATEMQKALMKARKDVQLGLGMDKNYMKQAYGGVANEFEYAEDIKAAYADEYVRATEAKAALARGYNGGKSRRRSKLSKSSKRRAKTRAKKGGARKVKK